MRPDPDDNTKETYRNEDKDLDNADTWSFIAAGVYFSKKCGREIPMPPFPTDKDKPKGSSKRAVLESRFDHKPRFLSMRQESCQVYDDVIVIDSDGSALTQDTSGIAHSPPDDISAEPDDPYGDQGGVGGSPP